VAHPRHGAELFLCDSPLRADAVPGRSEISAADGIAAFFLILPGLMIVSHA
jgi:hypothetical protein